MRTLSFYMVIVTSWWYDCDLCCKSKQNTWIEHTHTHIISNGANIEWHDPNAIAIYRSVCWWWPQLSAHNLKYWQISSPLGKIFPEIWYKLMNFSIFISFSLSLCVSIFYIEMGHGDYCMQIWKQIIFTYHMFIRICKVVVWRGKKIRSAMWCDQFRIFIMFCCNKPFVIEACA